MLMMDCYVFIAYRLIVGRLCHVWPPPPVVHRWPSARGSKCAPLPLSLHNFLASKLIVFDAKTNNLSLACHLFYQITHKNTSYNTLVIGYSINNRHLDAVNLFSRLCSQENPGLLALDKFSVTCLLKLLSNLLH